MFFKPKKNTCVNRIWNIFQTQTLIVWTIWGWMVFLLCYPVLATGQEEQSSIKLWTNTKEYTVKAEMSVPRPFGEIYRILTDYESIDEHISLFKVSRILTQQGETVRLYQTTRMKILFFNIESESFLLIHQKPPGEITFKEVKGDFREHRGFWKLVPENGRRTTLIKYEVQSIPNFFVPRQVVIYLMKREVRKAFQELYLWIMWETKISRTKLDITGKTVRRGIPEINKPSRLTEGK